MIASALAAGGVRMAPRMCGARTPPTEAITIDTTKKKTTAVPMIRLTIFRSPASTCWAIRMLAAMLTPNTAPSISIITLLALPMAVMSVTPSMWATQN